jgi:hypothetical protein
VAAPRLDDDGAETGASRRLHPCPQHLDHIAHPHQDQPRRVEPEGRQPRRMKPAGFAFGMGLAHPDHVLPRPSRSHRPQRKACGKARGGTRIGLRGGQDLVQARTRQPAAERVIKGSQAEAKDLSFPPPDGGRFEG